MSRLRVAVIGAGIGGLTLAIALAREGVEVTVYEQSDELTEIGAGVALSANATRLLARLGISELEEVSSRPSHLIMRRGLDGSEVARHALDETYEQHFGAPYYGVHRRDLQRVLIEAVGADTVRTGHRCGEVVEEADKARLTFEHGDSATADVVVAADGVHSVLREAVAGPDSAVFSGTSGFRALVAVEELPSLPDPGAIQFWMGDRRHLLHYPIHGGRVINILGVVRIGSWDSERWQAPCAADEPRHVFAGWCPAATEIAHSLSEGIRWGLFDREPLDAWSKGRVVLIGDAAHAMLPHQGQGANQTIEDAVALADCLTADPAAGHADAFARYERMRRDQTRHVQAASRWTADCLHLPEGPEAQARDLELGGLYETLAWIHASDVQAQGAAAAATT